MLPCPVPSESRGQPRNQFPIDLGSFGVRHADGIGSTSCVLPITQSCYLYHTLSLSTRNRSYLFHYGNAIRPLFRTRNHHVTCLCPILAILRCPLLVLAAGSCLEFSNLWCFFTIIPGYRHGTQFLGACLLVRLFSYFIHDTPFLGLALLSHLSAYREAGKTCSTVYPYYKAFLG